MYLGDSYKILQEIQDKSIDLIHTDPPYEMPGLNSDGMGKFGSAIYKKSIDKLKDIELTKGFDLRALSDFEKISTFKFGVTKDKFFNIFPMLKNIYGIGKISNYTELMHYLRFLENIKIQSTAFIFGKEEL